MSLAVIITLCITGCIIFGLICFVTMHLIEKLANPIIMGGEDRYRDGEPSEDKELATFIIDNFKVAALKMHEDGFILAQLRMYNNELIQEYNKLCQEEDYRKQRVAEYNAKVDEEKKGL